MSIERTPTNDQIAAVLLRTGNPTDEQKEQLAEYLGRAPSPEKAAPTPAEDMTDIVAGILTSHADRKYVLGSDLELAEEIVAALADREARPFLPDSREEREAREDLLFLTGERTARDYNEAINFAIDECDEPDLFLRVWREGGCEEHADEANEWADFRAYRARARQGGSHG